MWHHLAMETVHLIGLLPPSNLERLLTDVGAMLFRRFALVSARALPPLLPLLYTESPPPRPERDALPPAFPLSTGRWLSVDDSLFLSVEPASALETLAALLLARAAIDAGGNDAPRVDPALQRRPLPVGPPRGFFLARINEPQPPGHPSFAPVARGGPLSFETLHEELPPPPRFRWTAIEIGCLAIRYEDSAHWWDAVVCELLWRVRLRKEERGEEPTRRDTRR